ncbi:site-specific DNA-methyltransferase [Mycolicibacterium smegmatis]|uniref:Putative methyltransferase n=1 Tax=Mycolicibacterium smegmatis (strain MKD8) TaxID=1214915 RepID=A0A2U9PKM0_MYCSE|nr:site-specific DNA-methyltransferase [Mycolicibacterium smegmatis]AWT52238.1 putative methyltransferase [Mycolicibacterium smegmatis MKD8]
MTSPDLTEVNIDRLAELFPNVITETLDADGNPKKAVDFDLLRQELSDHVVEGPQERYRLDWPGKREAAFAANAPIAKTLRPIREESVNFDTTKNLFIEGDNLEALKLLQESYLGKVKLIYIDPPYNTGNDFVYSDDFAESTKEYLERSGQSDDNGVKLVANTESNGRFHSDWLSMMYPRLKLARNLLADDGLMFVSIDDSEAAGLSHIAGEIFGRDNVVAAIAWEKRYTRSNNANGFYSVKDTILLCRRSISAGRIKEVRGDGAADIYSNPDNDDRGVWTSSSYVNPATKEARPNLAYPITRPSDGAIIEHPTHAWKFSEGEHERHIRDNRLWWGKDGTAQYPRLKVFLSELSEGMVPIDLWSHEDAGTTDAGGAEVKELFDGAAVFDFPKPTRLLRKILGIYVPPWNSWADDFIVLDFFAGSSSMAHAVLAQNGADGGKRRFVMVQLPEPCPPKSIAASQGYENIAQLSRERIRRAGRRILEDAPLMAESLDVGFRALRVDSTNMADVLRSPDDTVQQTLGTLESSVKSNRSGDDLLFQVLLDWGLELTMPLTVEQLEGREVFVVDDDALIACFDSDVSPELVRTIAKREPLRAVFRDSGFASDDARINAEQIFREISPATDIKAI